jgi:peptidoglycan/xylan/chitin deacetylase (PgdA/CDA1 family)
MAGELGLDVVLWTVDTQDWMRPGAEAIANHILSNAAPGAIILMHDGGGDRTQTIEALRIALPQLRAQGYVFEALCG